MASFDDVEEVADFSLLDDDGGGRHRFGHHRVDELPALEVTQRREDEVVSEGVIDEVDGLLGLIVHGHDELRAQVDGWGEDILSALRSGVD